MAMKDGCKEKPVAFLSAVLPFYCFIICLEDGGEIQKPKSFLL